MNEIKALNKLVEDLQKLQAKAEAKIEKEKSKNSKKYIRFKGMDCYTHEDIDDVYRYDSCTNSECDKAHDRLDALLNTDASGKTISEYYVKIIRNMIYNLQTEIEEQEHK
jgi:hypothetical protein